MGTTIFFSTRTTWPHVFGILLMLLGVIELTWEFFIGKGSVRVLGITGHIKHGLAESLAFLHLGGKQYKIRVDTKDSGHMLPRRSSARPVAYSLDAEREVISTLRAKVRTASFLGTDTHCQFYPPEYWGQLPYRPTFNCDEDQAEHRHLVKTWVDRNIPLPLSQDLFLEQLKSLSENPDNRSGITELAKNVYDDIIEHNMNGYPRYVGLPKVLDDHLVIPLAPSYYGIHQLATRGILVPSWPHDSVPYSLGVRVAVTYRREGRWYTLFHQRSSDNGDYALAWDIGAAGYLNPDERSPNVSLTDGYLSPYAQAVHECWEELGFPRIGAATNAEVMEFFGVTRDTRLGTTTLCGEWRMPEGLIPNVGELNGERLSRKVVRIRECELTPDAVARFFVQPEPGSISAPRVVAEALLLTVLVLNSHSFNWSDIEATFAAQKVMHVVDFRPSVT